MEWHFSPAPDIVGVYESGGTTGAPKRVAVLRDWWDKYLAWVHADLDAKEFTRNLNWLTTTPSGPHLAGETCVRLAHSAAQAGYSAYLARPTGAVNDWRDQETRRGAAARIRCGEVFGVIAATTRPCTPCGWRLWPSAAACPSGPRGANR